MAIPHVRATQYAVNLLPESENTLGGHAYEITVEYRGHDQWAILRGHQCLGADGTWDWEPIPSERDDAWLTGHRFDHDAALRLAQEAAPHVEVNGRTATDALARLIASGRLAHTGGNAEDCPACCAADAEPDWPWVCPGPAVPCSAAVLRRPHPPHDWQPQPGVTPVHCPGTTPAKEA
ncbi:hypothetical protein ABZX40_13355 [Streptomyces sp. NPDC004610]|uniref:hypothetical protein n=1 Tax=unclassified Streptomyces TaxID=2593676 RepID=UPI0033AF542A